MYFVSFFVWLYVVVRQGATLVFLRKEKIFCVVPLVFNAKKGNVFRQANGLTAFF